MRDPATAGTTIEASAAMSARARRLWGVARLDQPYSKSACSGPTGVPARALQRPRSEGERGGRRRRMRSSARCRSTVRSISGRCWERWPGPGTPRCGSRRSGDSRLHHPCRAGSIELRVAGSEIRARAWGPGRRSSWTACPRCSASTTTTRGSNRACIRRLPSWRGAGVGLDWGAPARSGRRSCRRSSSNGSPGRRRGNYRRLVRWHGNRAPGPLALLAAPAPADVLAIPPWRLAGARSSLAGRWFAGGPRGGAARGHRRGRPAARRRRAGADLAAALRTIPGIGPGPRQR